VLTCRTRRTACLAPPMSSKILLLLLSLEAAHAASLAAPRMRPALRLRGGAETLEDADMQNDSPLTEEQIFEKLNQIPTFVIMGKGGLVALEIRDRGRAISFFLEPEEAKAVLNMTQTAHPDEAVHLASVGLGNALKLCQNSVGDEATNNALSFDGHLRLQGAAGLTIEVEPKLQKMLETAGMDQGQWQLPVFLCDELMTSDMLPIFFHPREIQTVWKRNDLDPEKMPQKFVMMDIRMMVADMQKAGTGVPWKKAMFVGAEGAAECANELQAARAAFTEA